MTLRQFSGNRMAVKDRSARCRVVVIVLGMKKDKEKMTWFTPL